MPAAIFISIALLALGASGEERSRRQPDGRLVIRETLPPMPRYIEGSVSFLRVTHGTEVLVDGRVTDGVSVRGREPVFSRVVEPGDYRVVSYQRPCDGNCQFLDPPVDRCETTVHVPSGETLFATVVLAQEGGCTIPAGTQCANRRWARSHLPGMRTNRARAAVKARGLEFRVVRRNGRDLFRTDDRILTRVNIAVRSGRVTGTGISTVSLAWDRSSHRWSFSYEVLMDGQVLAAAAHPFVGTPSTTLRKIPPGRHVFEVRARDYSGNVSGSSNAVTVDLAGNGDAAPPSAPTNLTVEDLNDNCGSLVLRWTPSTDNFDAQSQIEYELYRNGSFFQLTPPGTSEIGIYTPPGTQTWTVVAVDRAGNAQARATR